MPAKKINKKSKKIMISIRLHQYLLDYMAQVDKSRSDQIEEAMVNYYNLKVPDRKKSE